MGVEGRRWDAERRLRLNLDEEDDLELGILPDNGGDVVVMGSNGGEVGVEGLLATWKLGTGSEIHSAGKRRDERMDWSQRVFSASEAAAISKWWSTQERRNEWGTRAREGT